MTPPPRVTYLPSGDPVLAYGPDGAPAVVVVQPLFEEMNRCRATVAAACRALAVRGIAAWLPDLPGGGESATALETVRWDDWTAAVAATLTLAGTGATVAIRGGALLDGVGARRWRLSPVAGASLLADIRRTALTGGGGIEGYAIGTALRDALAVAEPQGTARTVRLSGDERACDARLDAPPPWRRAEPARDDMLAAAIATDVGDWL